MLDTIAVIPAKGFSDGVQNKNLSDIGGVPLFWHSVSYALAEGVKPIVATDDPRIRQYAETRGIPVSGNPVSPSSMIPAIREALNTFPAEQYVILQPSSPIRKPGLLREILTIQAPCVFTAERIKMVGILDGEMLVQYNRENSTSFFMHFDGSILTGTREMIEQETLFTPDAVAIEQRAPYTLQIDHVNDLKLIRTLYEHSHSW